MTFENVIKILENLTDKMSIAHLPPEKKVKMERAMTVGSALLGTVVGVLLNKSGHDGGVLVDAIFTLLATSTSGANWADARNEVFRLTATPEQREARAARQVQAMFSHPGL